MAGDAKNLEQVSELEIALYFTDNNEEAAKSMVAGEYKDQYALKGVFSSSSLSGAFLIFFCTPIQSPTNIYSVTTLFPVNEFDVEMDWLSFEKVIADIFVSGKSDDIKTSAVSAALSAGMTFSFNQELKKIFESSDHIMINYRFKKLLESKLEIQQLRLVIEVEPLSSLEIEFKSLSAKKLNLRDLKKRNKEEDNLKEVITETRRQDNPLAGKDVKALLYGKFILSPIKGKNISLLTQGDRVRVLITDKSSKATKIAQAFNAFDEKKQSVLPISGRVVSSRFFQKSGYEFYVIIAKGIYIKIIEDKKDIKITMAEETKLQGSSKRDKMQPVKPVVVWTCLAALVIIGVIIMLLI